MFVTTAGRTTRAMIQRAKDVAHDLEVDYVERNKQSIHLIQQLRQDDCFVVGKERLELYPYGDQKPFFFHPNSSMFRIKRLLAGKNDPFIDASQLREGKSLLDCTLGLASDSIVASFVVGESGKVVGIEGNRYLAYAVQNGLKTWDSGLEIMNGAMKRIKVVQQMSLTYLETLDNKSFDCVYLDPMFEEHIIESDGIQQLSRWAFFDDIEEELLQNAIRVAKEKVILKDHFRSKRFDKFGFHVNRRKTAKFHFGIIQVE